jgi:NAD(P)-dependent dehydrogenase (short-subunit alcohol dehydrogenase family)
VTATGRRCLRLPGDLGDLSATKGAILAFTYSLAQSLSTRGIRVNCVATGPVWTPLIPVTMDVERVESFGDHTPSDGRPSLTKSRRPTCFSPRESYRRITVATYSPQSGVRDAPRLT